MKIVLINATYGFASTGSIVADLESAAKLNNIEVGVAYQSAEALPDLGFKIGSRFDRLWHGFMTRVKGKQGYESRRATRRLVAWLEREKPDVVHLHNLHSNYVNLEILLGYLARRDIATVLTLHDCWFFTGKCFHFVESDCDRWQTGCGNCPRRRLDIKSLFFDVSARVHSDKKRLFGAIPRLYTVGCSKWISSLAEKSLLASGEVLQIYNGIDTEIFKPSATDFKARYGIEGKFIVCGAANKWLLPENRPLLDAFLENRAEDELLLLFGAIAEHKRAVEGMGGVVALDYFAEKRQMAELFAASDVFVNPTHADTLPTVNMEAAACGTPVVTYDVCGSPELVRDGVSGFVVPEGDVGGMLEAIRRVRCGEIERTACREFAIDSFDKKENYKKYIELYEKIYSGE